MKVCIDARSVNLHEGTGIGTYTKNVISEMININKEDSFDLIWTGIFPKTELAFLLNMI